MHGHAKPLRQEFLYDRHMVGILLRGFQNAAVSIQHPQ
jgi:hypothetical protein